MNDITKTIIREFYQRLLDEAARADDDDRCDLAEFAAAKAKGVADLAAALGVDLETSDDHS